MTTHKAIREALEAYQHMLNNGHTSGYAFAVAFGDLDPAGCIESLLADLDAKTAELERLRALHHVEMTDEQIIEIRKASKPTGPVEQWGMTLSFARKLIKAYRGITQEGQE